MYYIKNIVKVINNYFNNNVLSRVKYCIFCNIEIVTTVSFSYYIIVSYRDEIDVNKNNNV